MDLAAVILAAGKGTRMESDLPKVLHKIAGRPMVSYVVEVAKEVGANPIILVVGHMAEKVQEEIGEKYTYSIQEELNGTAGAVKTAKEALKNHNGTILVLCGDAPLLTKETLTDLIQKHRESSASATVLTVKLDNPFAYGRIVRDKNGTIKIVEEKDATEEEKKIKEVNTGTYCFEKEALFEALDQVQPNNAQSEYYLTDVLEILNNKGHKVISYATENKDEIIGINTKEALENVERIFLEKTCDKCGVCCKLFLINLNEEEYLSGIYKTVNQEYGVFNDFSQAQECGANLLAQNPDGSCIYLANGTCEIHKTRPAVCREFFCKGSEPKFNEMREIIQKVK